VATAEGPELVALAYRVGAMAPPTTIEVTLRLPPPLAGAVRVPVGKARDTA